MTFRIELFCEDKNLSGILRALADAGAYNVLPTPVIMESAGNGAVAGVSPKVAVAYNNLVAAKVDCFTLTALRKAMKSSGLDAASTSYVCESMVKAKLIRKTGERGNYQMVKGA